MSFTSCGAASSFDNLDALIFDCDGVILESEDLHREAYNQAFAHFGVAIDGEPVVWTEEFYDVLQNTVGGGKPKMRWYFGEHKDAWPTHTCDVCAVGIATSKCAQIDWRSCVCHACGEVVV